MGSSNSSIQTDKSSDKNSKTCYGDPMGLGCGGNLEFHFGFGMNGVSALKNGDDGNWWSFPTTNVVNVSLPVVAVAPAKSKKAPVEQKKRKVEVAVALAKLTKAPVEQKKKKKKKKKKVEVAVARWNKRRRRWRWRWLRRS
ncbi:hypothetical protein OSB04_un000622 [Centaurea solstitialis]|uniref:Uncharacterized protein n=1 Tax=Centaurea solstitialis TaxID=347529 RepID=A0AA38VRP1_9ASTR|nr:hypothetical protein OSB04_un000622 [Centaurea solstitialis]